MKRSVSDSQNKDRSLIMKHFFLEKKRKFKDVDGIVFVLGTVRITRLALTSFFSLKLLNFISLKLLNFIDCEL